jgi:hypothetical protein
VYDTRSHAPLTVHQLSKVLVGRDENATNRVGSFENETVGDARLEFSHVDEVMPVRAQSVNDLPVDAFVGDEIQGVFPSLG